MNNKYALITGGTAGIGLDIARELAKQGHNILLTARREERLKEISASLKEEFNVESNYIVADLAQVSAPEMIYNFCSEKNYIVEILVNNAGYSINKKFHETVPYHFNSNTYLFSFQVILQAKLFKLRSSEISISSVYNKDVSSCGYLEGFIYLLRNFEIILMFYMAKFKIYTNSIFKKID